MNRRKTIRVTLGMLLSLSVLAFLQVQCRHDGLNVATLKPVCFDTQIAPIFINSCGNCHNQTTMRAGYSYTDYNSILKSVKPYNAEKSIAYQAITGKSFTQLMPPGIPLSENDRILIRVWIDQGAQNTTCGTPVVVVPGTGGTPPGAVKDQVCFQRDILPVLLSSCGTTGCHDQLTHKEGYTIIDYASVMSNLVQAGSPSTSKLYNVINNSPGSENFMPPPPYAALSQAVKDSIYNWISDGALNNTCSSSCDTTGVVTYQNQISTLISRNCISCHSGSTAQKGILLDSYAAVKQNMVNGNIMSAVQGVTLQMPPGYQITSCEMRQLQLWKANGEIQN